MPALPRAWSTRLLRLVVLAMASALLLELVMQIGSVVLWLSSPAPVVPASSQTILCVGDSWTHGMGSSRPGELGYPAILEQTVRGASTLEWSTLNCGQAGQNSRDVLERMPDQLASYSPRIVLILVGQNDFWSHPARLHLDANATGRGAGQYRFRWRLPRLVAWLGGVITGQGRLEPDRTEPEWQPVDVEYRSAYPAPATSWANNEQTRELLRQCWSAAARGQFETALRAAESVLELEPTDPRAHDLRARMLRKCGRLDEAQVELDQLERAARRADAAYAETLAYCNALSELGELDQRLQTMRAACERFGQSDELWSLLGVAEFHGGDPAAGLRAMDRALALQPRPHHYLHRAHILQIGLDDVGGAVRSLFAAYLTFNDAAWLEQRLRDVLVAGGVDAEAMIADLACTEAQRDRLRQIVDRVSLADQKGVAATLASHLEQAIALCRGHGAVPVLLTYPQETPPGEVARRVAAAEGVQLVDVAHWFFTRAGGRPWAELSAPDGHCNDSGYAIMGALVADHLWTLLDEALPPPCGLWQSHAPRMDLTLRPDGSGQIAGLPLRWQLRDDQRLELKIQGDVTAVTEEPLTGDSFVLVFAGKMRTEFRYGI